MNLEGFCSGLNIVSHTGCGEQAVFCVLISSFQTAPEQVGRASKNNSLMHEKAQPSFHLFVLLHCIIYAGAGTDSQLDLVNQPKTMLRVGKRRQLHSSVLVDFQLLY